MDSFLSYLISWLPDTSNPFVAMWIVFIKGGWIFVILALMRGFWWLYLFEIRSGYASKLESILLAVHVPKATEQTPKAVENIFSHFTGLLGGGNLIDKYIKGKIQENFSCELVSRGGVIFYYLRIPAGLRDIFESALFAQYPDIDIKEVPDYVDEVPHTYPDEKYDLWGSELCTSKPEAYPIKTYIAFEHSLTATFKDPLASLLEFLGTLRLGEEVWIQFVLLPYPDKWKEESDLLVKKLIGAKIPKKPTPVHVSVIQIILDVFVTLFHTLTGSVTAPKPAGPKPEAPPSIMQHLSPGERSAVEQIQLKSAKTGFLTKIRIVYVGKKEVFNKGRAIVGVLGSFRQFAGLNEFTLDKFTKTGANYFFVKRRVAKRQNKLIKAYKGRSTGKGGKKFVLNIEELATLWHFPLIDTKAPLIMKSESKKAEPPVNLPFSEGLREGGVSEPVKQRAPQEEEIPDNLPFV